MLGKSENQELLNNNIEQSRKQGPTPFFHSDTNLVLGHVLVLSVDKSHVPAVTVESIWLFFLSIYSFNFILMLHKSLRFRRFIRSYVNCHVVVPTNNCQICTAFFAWCALFEVATFLFSHCLFPIIVHLLNLFLLSTPVVWMLLTRK